MGLRDNRCIKAKENELGLVDSQMSAENGSIYVF